MAEHVILFAGPMGAGKTTAIQSLSEIDVVLTEGANTDRDTADKDTTTVALDYGEISLGLDDKVRLYGIPGQRRFDFMWSILKERAKGMILLVNSDAANPIESMLEFLTEFEELYSRGGIVIGISRTDVSRGRATDEYCDAIQGSHPGMVIPVFTVDPRDKGQMTMMLMALIANSETRAVLAREGATS